MGKLISATLEQIAKANGKLTGDEIQTQRRLQELADKKVFMDALPKWMNSQQRKALSKCLRKAAAMDEQA